MNYSKLFLQAWQRTRHNKLLWFLGGLASLGSIAITLSRLWLTATIAGRLPDLDAWLAQPDTLFLWLEPLLAQAGFWPIAGVAVVLFVSLGLWLVMTIAEGGLIVTVLQLEAGQPFGWRQALGAGRQLLARFIGIDTVLFFPLFLLILLLMLLVTGMLVGTAVLSLGDATSYSALRLLTAGGICLIPLLCLLLPGTVLTTIFRTLAFRDAASRHTGVRDSIRHTRHLFQQNAGLLLLLFALLWGISYLANLFLGLSAMPLIGLTAAPRLLAAGTNTSFVWTDTAAWIYIIALAIISVLSQAMIHAYAATVWTLACSQLIAGVGPRHSHQDLAEASLV